MPLKDYYKILEVAPSASLPEIKKAYRRLAQQYHPDKNSGKEYALVYFTEIKEAYEILTNPGKKDHYLQQRWYQQSLGRKEFQSQPVTPPRILKQFIELDKYVHQLDSFRMDKPGLYGYISSLLSEEIIEQLKKFNEPDTMNEITGIALRVAGYLQFEAAKDVAAKLYSLCPDKTATRRRIDHFLDQLQQKNQWEKYKIPVIILVTVIISILIYLSSR